jgi:hypothetical protein
MGVGDIVNAVRQLKPPWSSIESAAFDWPTTSSTSCTCSAIPLTLGGGKRIFSEGALRKFKLHEATPYPTGVVGLHYERLMSGREREREREREARGEGDRGSGIGDR